MNDKHIIGWREWGEFPEWGIRMRAKADTGAKSSAIDCAEIIELPDERVRFTVRLDRKETNLITLEAPIARRTHVKSSTGHGHDRIFIETTMKMANVEKRILVSLVCRKKMIHRLLLGRTTLCDHFLVDSGVDHWLTPKRRKKKA